MSERLEALPFQPPSEELLALLRECEEYAARRDALCTFEWSAGELYGLGELTPLQIDRLLSR